MLKISNLSFARGNKLVLKKINLSISHSEIVLIKGPNGSGKSTLLSCLANFIEPLEGTVHYYSDLINPTISSKNFIFISEENYAFEDLSVLENIHYWLTINGVTPNDKAINRSINFLYNELNINKKFLHLSFGQKRKLRMLLLMLIDKPIWILDDPFNGLDEESIKKLTKIISMKRDQQGMIIIATHIMPMLTGLKEYNLL